MKLTIERILLVVGTFVLIIFIFRDCSRPSEQREAEKEKQYKTTIAILEQEKNEIQSKQDASVKRYKDKVKSDSLNLALQSARIQALKSKLVNQRPKVIEKIQADSAVLSYVNTLEEVVTEVQIQNDTLKAQAQFQRKLNEDLIFTEMVEDKVEQEMALQSSRRIADLEKALRKREKRSRLAKILIPIVGVAAFLVGAAL